MRSDDVGAIKGQLLGAFTVDPLNVPTLTTLDTVVAVPGAQVGDVILVNPVQDLEAGLGLAQWSWVNAADQVTVRYWNSAAADINPVAHSLRMWRLSGNFAAGDVIRHGVRGPIVGQYLGSQSVDVANIPASSSVHTDIPVTGARQADVILCCIDQGTPFTGGTCYGGVRCNNDGIVRLTMVNLTLGAIDPAARTFHFYRFSVAAESKARAIEGPVRAEFLGPLSVDFPNAGARDTTAINVANANVQAGDILVSSPLAAHTANLAVLGSQVPTSGGNARPIQVNPTAGALDAAAVNANFWRLSTNEVA